jgi:hypothetical protein
MEKLKYPHRCNRDGTIDSICPHCFVTIGSSMWESELELMELAHVCDAQALEHFEKQARTPVIGDHASADHTGSARPWTDGTRKNR